MKPGTLGPLPHLVGRLLQQRSRRVIPRVTATLMLALLPWSPARSAEAPDVRTLRFTVFSAHPITDVGFVPRARTPPQKLTFQPTARSSRYEYRGPLPLRFVDAVTGDMVAEAAIPDGIQNAMLLFSRIAPAAGSATALRYRIAVLDDGAGRHGPGGLAIINLSGLTLNGSVNDRNIALQPGLNPTLAVGRSARIVLRTVFKERTYQSYTGTANLRSDERALLILFPPFYDGGLEVQPRLLVDQPPRP